MLWALNILTGWIQFLSLALVIGVGTGRWLLLRSPEAATFPATTEMRCSAAHLGAGAAAGLVAAMGLIFLRQLLEFRDPFVPWTEDARLLLTATGWGMTWLVGVGLTFLVLVAYRFAAGQSSTGWLLATIGALFLGAFPALTGHANTGDLRGLTLTADILHMWAVGAWIGGLTLVLFLEYRRSGVSETPRPSRLPVLVPRFSPVAMASVAILATTGLFASWVHLSSVSDLWDTAYGRLLVTKLVLVGVVLALGAFNFKRLTPRLGEPQGPAAMRRAATLEFLVANAVLALTAVLTRTSPM